MEFITRKKKPKTVVSDNLSEVYSHDLQLYATPPENEISLMEFEELAFDRLKLLRILEETTQKGLKIYSKSWIEVVMTDLRKQGLTKYIYLLEPRNETLSLQARRADHLSHFILRLAYCRSNDLRRWFLSREIEWFKLRFIKIAERNPLEIKRFLDINKLVYESISTQTKQQLRTQLYDSGCDHIESIEFYKVHFTKVLSLVKNRRVYIKHGFAYIPESELITCILFLFRTQLNQSLAYSSRKISLLDDDRINSLLKGLHTSYTGQKYTSSDEKDAVNTEHLDLYSRKHFPICMRHTHEVFRSTHHLKHGARMQYGLFIKGIGVKFDDMMKYWRDEFTKKIDIGQFEKQYSYLIKHHYGKVGSMINYSPYSCIKIITGSIGIGDSHGCPFKHFNASNLQQKLNEYGIPSSGIQEILNLVNSSHYQIACTKYFEYTHGQPSKNVINHPNQYFDESRASLTENVKSTKKQKFSIDLPNAEAIFAEEM